MTERLPLSLLLQNFKNSHESESCTLSLCDPKFLVYNRVRSLLNTLSCQLPDSSVGKESACQAGDPGLIPWSGRSPGEGIGYPLQYSWAFLVAQLVKNPPAVWEIWVRSLGWEDPLKKETAIHSSILACRIPQTVLFMGLQRVRHD